MNDRQHLDCGEARFTAWGGRMGPAITPTQIRDRMDTELSGTTNTNGGTWQPLKAAMARRSPKRGNASFPEIRPQAIIHDAAGFAASADVKRRHGK